MPGRRFARVRAKKGNLFMWAPKANSFAEPNFGGNQPNLFGQDPNGLATLPTR
jgi:hypothetical protein